MQMRETKTVKGIKRHLVKERELNPCPAVVKCQVNPHLIRILQTLIQKLALVLLRRPVPALVQ